MFKKIDAVASTDMQTAIEKVVQALTVFYMCRIGSLSPWKVHPRGKECMDGLYQL